MNTKQLVGEFLSCIAKGYPYLTTNVGRADLLQGVDLILQLEIEKADLQKQLDKQISVNADYLYIIKQHQKKLGIITKTSVKDPGLTRFNQMQEQGLFPAMEELHTYSYAEVQTELAKVGYVV